MRNEAMSLNQEKPHSMTQVIVTRPEQDATSWMTQLREGGLETISLPLLTLSDLMSSEDAAKASQALEPTGAALTSRTSSASSRERRSAASLNRSFA